MSTSSNDLDLPRGIALAWGVAASPQRGPKREMSVERIVEAAMEIADAEGLGAVSMAAVAGRLGFTPMSLYRYVSAKDDLIQLMMEGATGVPPESIRDEVGWRARLGAVHRAMVAAYTSHPWILDIPITGSPATPNSAAFMDVGLEALAETALDQDERLAVVLMLTGHARWFGTVVAGYARRARETAMSQDEIAAAENALFDALIAEAEFPALHAAVQAGVFRSDADPFAFALERFLDGLSDYIERRGAGAPRPPARTWSDDASAEAIANDKRVREARKAVADAEKALRAARKVERQAAADAAARVAR